MTPAELRRPEEPLQHCKQDGLARRHRSTIPARRPSGCGEPAARVSGCYFVAIDKQGHSAFSATIAEHEKNIGKPPGVTAFCDRCAPCRGLGRPIDHSLSPVIHNAGFAAAGLPTWAYTAIEWAEAELAELVAGPGAEWAGLSLTMPLKEVGLAWPPRFTDRGRGRRGNTLVAGAGRFLVRRQHRRSGHGARSPARRRRAAVRGGTRGWRHRARRLRGRRPVGRGVVTVVARRAERSRSCARWPLLGWSDRRTWEPGRPRRRRRHLHGAEGRGRPTGRVRRPGDPARSCSTRSTTRGRPRWPPPRRRTECRVASGLDLLLAQALGQFEQFTGVVPAPEVAMREALTAAAALR